MENPLVEFSIFYSPMKGVAFVMPQSEGIMYLAGFFLRFGVPLGLTLFFAWLLKNLDLQWLKEAQSENQDQRSDELRIPQDCWILQNIPHGKDPNEVFPEACWKVRMNFEGFLPDQCLDCRYFEAGILENAA
jgi:hypothetical protein